MLEPPESRIMVNLEAIELVSNLDDTRLLTGTSTGGNGGSSLVSSGAGFSAVGGQVQGHGVSSGGGGDYIEPASCSSSSSNTSTISSTSSSSKCLSKFSSP